MYNRTIHAAYTLPPTEEQKGIKLIITSTTWLIQITLCCSHSSVAPTIETSTRQQLFADREQA